MNQDIELLYRFLLQQVVAEAYLEGLRLGGEDDDLLKAALRNGNNRLSPDLPISGLTRLTEVQINEFLGSHRIIHQLSDNPTDGQPKTFNGIPLNTGFSATLIQDETTGDYTLSIRSTEFKHWAQGGDKERDAFGADWALSMS